MLCGNGRVRTQNLGIPSHDLPTALGALYTVYIHTQYTYCVCTVYILCMSRFICIYVRLGELCTAPVSRQSLLLCLHSHTVYVCMCVCVCARACACVCARARSIHISCRSSSRRAPSATRCTSSRCSRSRPRALRSAPEICGGDHPRASPHPQAGERHAAAAAARRCARAWHGGGPTRSARPTCGRAADGRPGPRPVLPASDLRRRPSPSLPTSP